MIIKRNPEKIPIGEYLYKKKDEINRNKEKLIEKSKKEIELARAHSIEKSESILENIKFKKLEEIFNCLDSNQDGYISAQEIEIGNLSTEILEAFAPLLCEMEQMNFSLNFEMFFEAANRLLRVNIFFFVNVFNINCEKRHLMFMIKIRSCLAKKTTKKKNLKIIVLEYFDNN